MARTLTVLRQVETAPGPVLEAWSTRYRQAWNGTSDANPAQWSSSWMAEAVRNPKVAESLRAPDYARAAG